MLGYFSRVRGTIAANRGRGLTEPVYEIGSIGLFGTITSDFSKNTENET
jgi:hypothetical protein